MDAGLKRDVPSFEDSGGEFSVVKDLTPSLYAKRRKSQTFVKKAGEQHDDTTNNRACVVYAEQAARDLVAALQLAHARFQLRNTLLFGGLVLTGWAAV